MRNFRDFELSPCAQTLLSLIVLNGQVDIDRLRELIVPFADELGIAGGDWIDHLQSLITCHFVIRIRTVDGYLYGSTEHGQRTFEGFLKNRPAGATAS